MPSIWIAILYISAPTAEKLTGLHDLDPDDLRQALVCVPGVQGKWDDDPERGRRAQLKVRVGDLNVLVILYPNDDPLGDAWDLGSAYRIP